MKYCLLDHLAQHFKVEYVSDLKDHNILYPYQDYIQSISEDIFTLDDWRDTCAYLTGTEKEIASIKEAKKDILHWLNHK